MAQTPERWRHVARIYELAVERDEASRDAALAEACGDDDALRREVESLLRLEPADALVDRPVWSLAAPLFGELSRLVEGTFLGPYRIDAPLGTGGMGQVFLATDTRLQRPVAIKVLQTGAALDPEIRARFAREARAVAALRHPHICTLYDVGRHDGVDFLVMEYLEGHTLAARLAEGRMPADEAIRYAIQIGDALDHAHRHGIVHRDLKPANVILTAGGATLLDFGLATFRADYAVADARTTGSPAGQAAGATGGARTEEEATTRTGALLGTLCYMAPERLEGADADARSDIFAFGALLFEMLTGTRAFDGADPRAIGAAVREADPPPVSVVEPLAPRALDPVVRRSLAKDPDHRWQSAADVVRELERASLVLDGADGREVRRPATANAIALRWAAGTLLATLAALAAWTGSDGLPRAAGSLRQIRSIAVLPLENRSGDPEQDYLADGMTEQLIADVAASSGLRVISSSSVMHYKLAPAPVPAVARDLQVDAVIQGSILRRGDRIRLTAAATAGATGDVISTQSIDGDLRDMLALSKSMARTVTARLTSAPADRDTAPLAPMQPIDPDVHREVLLGRHHAAKGTEDGLRTALRYFDSAVSHDSGNARAHAGLAQAYTELAGFYMDPREAMPKAIRAARTALRIDDAQAEAHAALGYAHLVYTWDGPAAAASLSRALALNPTLAPARLNYAAYLTTQGRNDEAIREVRRAVDLDPLSARTYTLGTILLLFARDVDAAIALARQGLELEPNASLMLAFQGVAYAEQRRFGEAVDNLERAAHLDGSLTIRALQAHVLAAAGRKAQAARVLRQVQDEAARRYFCPYEIATVYVTLGDHDTAYALFRRGVDERADCMAWLGVEPWIEPFRADPRYRELLGRIGLTSAAR